MLNALIAVLISTLYMDNLQIYHFNCSSSSSSLFQSQRSLKSQLNRKQSMLTIISTGNREEAKWPKWSSSLLLPSLIKLRNFKMELENLCQTNIYNFCWTRLRFHTYIYTKTRMYNTSKIRTPKKMQFLFTNKQKSKKKSSIYIRKWCNCKAQ